MGKTKYMGAMLGAAALAAPALSAAAEYEQDRRFYIAPMASYGWFGDTKEGGQNTRPTPPGANFNPTRGIPVGRLETDVDFDEGAGGTIAIGKAISSALNFELYAFKFDGIETDATFTSSTFVASDNGFDTDIEGFGAAVLLFPFQRNKLPIFGLFGYGAGNYESDSPLMGRGDGDTAFLDFGLGYLYQFTDYRLGIRAEYRYRQTDVELDDAPDLELDNHIVNIGLQIPLGAPPAKIEPPKPEPAAAKPTPPPPPPPEPRDSDGDGVLDKNDECPGTPAGTEVDAKGCPVKKAAPIILKGVNFEFNSDKLTSDAENRLDNVVNALSSSPEIEVRLEGHTDSKGSNSYNQRLSQQRADAVKRYLVQHGIDAGRLTTQGFGESQPIAPNTNQDGSDNPAGRAKNRRTELEVTKQ